MRAAAPAEDSTAAGSVACVALAGDDAQRAARDPRGFALELLPRLWAPDPQAQLAAARTVVALCTGSTAAVEPACAALLACGAVQALLAVSQGSAADETTAHAAACRLEATRALAALTARHAPSRATLVNADGCLQSVVTLLREARSEELTCETAALLCQLCADANEKSLKAVFEAGGLVALVELLRSSVVKYTPGNGGGGVHQYACHALHTFACVPQLHDRLRDAGVVDVLRLVAESCHDRHATKIAKDALVLFEQPRPRFDVFISHKRSDAKDFARGLYNMLTLRASASFWTLNIERNLTTSMPSCRPAAI
jgi:hypothetical protein